MTPEKTRVLHYPSVVAFDIDGVLNHAGIWQRNQLRGKVPPGVDWLDATCVDRLDQLALGTSSFLVCVSAWPCYLPGHEWQATQILVKAGLTSPLVGWTPTACPRDVRPEDFAERWQKLKDWLDRFVPDRWVLLDDVHFKGVPPEKLVRVSPDKGLTEKDCRLARSILEGKNLLVS